MPEPVSILQSWGILCMLLLPVCHSYGTGASTKSCDTLEPGHTGLQTSSSPYTIDFLGYTNYRKGMPFYIQVKGPDYRGILIQARQSNGSLVGKFLSSPTGTKFLTCTSANDTVTHSSTALKSENLNEKFHYEPPYEDVGNIFFIATIAESKNKYWMNITSAELPFKGDEISTPSFPSPTSATSTPSSPSSTSGTPTPNSPLPISVTPTPNYPSPTNVTTHVKALEVSEDTDSMDSSYSSTQTPKPDANQGSTHMEGESGVKPTKSSAQLNAISSLCISVSILYTVMVHFFV